MVLSLEFATRPEIIEGYSPQISEIEQRPTQEINIDRIIRDVPVEREHVEDLARSFLEDDQMIPLLVRQRHQPPDGKKDIDIIDGFHRAEARIFLVEKGLSKRETLTCVVLGESECDDEKMYDLRILSATTHKGVRFARVFEWINGAFAVTPWAEKINAYQVFNLATTDSSGRNLGLTPQEAKEIKGWARRKAKAWHTTVSTIAHDLLATVGIDPKLLKEIRESSLRRTSGLLTPAQLDSLRQHLAFRYDLQWQVAKVVKEYQLPAYAAEQLAYQVAQAENDSAIEEILSYDWKQIAASVRPHRRREERGEPLISSEQRLSLEGRLREVTAENYGLREALKEYELVFDHQQLVIERLRTRLIKTLPFTPAGYQEPSQIILDRRLGGEIIFDRATGEVRSAEVTLQMLTASERDVLLALIDNMGLPLVPRQILIRTKGKLPAFKDEENLIRQYIRSIRDKLDLVAPGLSERLQTIRGIGYRWQGHEEEEYFG